MVVNSSADCFSAAFDPGCEVSDLPADEIDLVDRHLMEDHYFTEDKLVGAMGKPKKNKTTKSR